MRPFGFNLFTVLVFLLAGLGCRRQPVPATLTEAQVLAETQLAETRMARLAAKPESAAKAAQAAVDAEKAARALYEKLTVPTETEKAGFRATSVAAREAVFVARLAGEDEQCRKILKSLKARTVHQALDVAVKGGLLGFEEAANLMAAAEKNGKEPPLKVKELAEDGRRLLVDVLKFNRQLSSLSEAEAGKTPSWSEVAAELAQLRKKPSVEFGSAMALMMAVAGQPGSALIEIEAVDANATQASANRQGYVLTRAIVWYLNGLSGKAIELLLEELAKSPLPANANLEMVRELTADKGVALHLAVAVLLLNEGKYLEADKHLAIVVQLMPDNEFIKLIQSESAAAQGETEKAVQFAESCKTSDNQWLKELAIKRAQEVRDNPLKQERLFSDPQFVLKLFAAFFHETAQKSETVAKIENLFAAARDFSARWSPATK
jgi:hypothetical protein